MSNSLSNGVSVTVSTDELESEIDAVSGKFIKTLSKSQKSLKMSIDEMGRYVNATRQAPKEGGAFQQERDKEFTAAP